MKTNTTLNGAPVLVKPFLCKGEETWCNSTRPTKGVLRIYPETAELEVCINEGCDPYAGDIVNFVLGDKDVRTLIHMYQQKGRVKPYAMRFSTGISGREDYFINFPDSAGLIVSGKHLLHISCYGKVAGVRKMYIGDFVELVAKFYENSSFCSDFTTGKYVKPYFAEDVKTEVTKIL